MAKRYWFLPLILLPILFTFNSCDELNLGKHLKLQGIILGNPLNPTQASAKILKAACDVLMVSHPGMTPQQCQDGVLSTTFSTNLGVPPEVLNPYWNLSDAEQAGAVKADSVSLDSCVSDIGRLNPQSPAVQSAYDSSKFNPFVGVAGMIPAEGSACPNVYKNNSFANPSPTPPPPGTMVLDFDSRPSVLPPAWSDPVLNGVFGDIDFGYNLWRWEEAYNADTTGNIYAEDVTTAGFSFSGGPKTLVSLNVFSSKVGAQITVSDDQGQSVTQFIPNDRAMHPVVTGFVKPSNVIMLSFSSLNTFGFDDITYVKPLNPPTIAYIQSRETVSVDYSNSANFLTDTTPGNLIVVRVNWVALFTIQSISDSQGNTFVSAVGPTTAGPTGASDIFGQQIWYAKNIRGGHDTITITLAGNHQDLKSYLHVYEYAGLDRVNPLDVTAAASGVGLVADSGFAATSSATELIFGGGAALDTPYSIGPGFTSRGTLDGGRGEDMIVTSQGSYHTTLMLQNSDPWLVQMVTFRAASGSQPPPPP